MLVPQVPLGTVYEVVMPQAVEQVPAAAQQVEPEQKVEQLEKLLVVQLPFSKVAAVEQTGSD